MDQLLTDNIWEQVVKIIPQKLKKRAAIAYVTSDKYIVFSKGDILICDASDSAIKSAETSAKTLNTFYKNGATLYSLEKLHSKVIVFGNQDCALIGSSNLSISSADMLTELSLLTDRSQIMSQSIAFIYSLIKKAQPIDKKFIENISQIKVVRKTHHSIKRDKIKLLGNKMWIVSVKELSEYSYKNEEIYLKNAEKITSEKIDNDSDVYRIRFTGNSRFRKLATEGDAVIIIHKDHKGEVTVWNPKPIIYRIDQNNWTRFYFEIGQNEEFLLWEDFKKKIDKTGILYITPNSTRELRPHHISLLETFWGKPITLDY